MPYRIRGNSVQVNKGGKWQTLKTYSGADAKVRALAYLRALEVNAYKGKKK